MPDTRPGSQFKDGVCGACRNYKVRSGVDWEHRERELDELLSRFKGNKGYDCLIAVSGGKDSYRIGCS
jgi:tRNA(Ile)-lysidine synthase TilS/MesJ